MNQRKFLNLLNLYIDGEIRPADAAELEKEIKASPKRRKIYDDYCRIHRATKMVYDRFREAPASQGFEGVRVFQESTQAPRHQVDGHAGRLSNTSWLNIMGGLAAAASVVFILNFRESPQEVATRSGPKSVSAPSASIELAQQDGTPAIAAPFTDVVRSDPYVSPEPTTRENPFSLAATSQQPEMAWPTRASDTQISSPFGVPQPAVDVAAPLESPLQAVTTEADRSTPSGPVFKSGGNTQTTPLEVESVGFTTHR